MRGQGGETTQGSSILESAVAPLHYSTFNVQRVTGFDPGPKLKFGLDVQTKCERGPLLLASCHYLSLPFYVDERNVLAFCTQNESFDGVCAGPCISLQYFQ
jgi:hypothetical protein